jgi:ATP-dependent DNA ligase
MLATSTQPFDDPSCLFEVKWDGVRALTAVEHDGIRLWGREGADYSGRYPDLEVLRRTPAGTMLDGELVMVHDGLPDFHASAASVAAGSVAEIFIRHAVISKLFHWSPFAALLASVAQYRPA